MPLVVVDAGVVPDVDDAHFCWCDVLKNPHNNRLVSFTLVFEILRDIYIYIKEKKGERKNGKNILLKKIETQIRLKKKKVHPPFPSFFDLLTRNDTTSFDIRDLFDDFFFCFIQFNERYIFYNESNFRSQEINISFIGN